MKRISIRLDDNTHTKLWDLANQEGLSLSESIRTHLEKQINNEIPTFQDDKAIKEQASNEKTVTQEQPDKMSWEELNQLYIKQEKEKEKNLKEQINKLLNIHAH